jgi:hypothetical protein
LQALLRVLDCHSEKLSFAFVRACECEFLCAGRISYGIDIVLSRSSLIDYQGNIMSQQPDNSGSGARAIAGDANGHAKLSGNGTNGVHNNGKTTAGGGDGKDKQRTGKLLEIVMVVSIVLVTLIPHLQSVRSSGWIHHTEAHKWETDSITVDMLQSAAKNFFNAINVHNYLAENLCIHAINCCLLYVLINRLVCMKFLPVDGVRLAGGAEIVG